MTKQTKEISAYRKLAGAFILGAAVMGNLVDYVGIPIQTKYEERRYSLSAYNLAEKILEIADINHDSRLSSDELTNLMRRLK